MTEKWTGPRTKVIGIPLAKTMQKQQDGTLIVRGYFTSDHRDEVGDTITRSATERAIPKFRQWGNIRRMHLPDPVGKVLRIGLEDGLEWNEVEIKVIDPKAVFEVENGLLPALSVGILLNLDDIEMMEDGGWMIHNYTLAEISLVDHPANYDARLKNLPVDQGLRTLAREYGMDVLARSMANLLDRELAMEEQNTVEKDAIETEPVEKSHETPTEETPVKETPAAEAAAEETLVEAVEKSEEPAVEETPATEEAPAAEDRLKNLEDGFRSLAEAIAALTETVKALAEAPKAEEQAEGDAEGAEKAAAPTDEVLEDPEPVEEVGAPADRKGALPETTLPDGQAQVEKSQPVVDLKQALSKYFASRNK